MRGVVGGFHIRYCNTSMLPRAHLSHLRRFLEIPACGIFVLGCCFRPLEFSEAKKDPRIVPQCSHGHVVYVGMLITRALWGHDCQEHHIYVHGCTLYRYMGLYTVVYEHVFAASFLCSAESEPYKETRFRSLEILPPARHKDGQSCASALGVKDPKLLFGQELADAG